MNALELFLLFAAGISAAAFAVIFFAVELPARREIARLHDP